MSKNKINSVKKSISFSSLMSDNKFVFVLSLVIAVICWTLVSMSQTTEIERTFKDVPVNINVDESIAKNNGLEMFGNQTFSVDVTVNGFSYVLNDPAFTNENINVTASCSSVTAAGTYDLPVSATVSGVSGDVEVVKLSSNTVKVSFDERVSKTFALTEEIKELEGYSLKQGFIRENPRLSVDSLTLSGPAKEMGKITALKAVAELDKELTVTTNLEAEIVAESANGTVDLANFTFEITDPVYITIPVSQVGTYETAVDFIGMPQAYRTDGIEYNVYPSQVDLSVQTGVGETVLDESNKLLIGTIDFNKINNVVNRITVVNKDIASDVKQFTVTIDMSSMSKRWLEIPVDVSSVNLPEGVKVLSESVESVQIVGPASSVMGIDQTAAYAVPVLDGIELTSGKHTVPAKIILRTLTDSWIHGTSYTVEIEVE
ncbi:MAG: hypothetical protein E7535_03420 [Ruminococcaceae bacterium]|nr:hypothetical protein [Oscillospiraceae bacterium]